MIPFCQLGIRLLAVKVLVKYCLGISSVSTLELFPTDMAFVHLDTVLGSIFLYNCAPTKNAFFLFITFERRNALIVICTTAISAYFLSINPFLLILQPFFLSLVLLKIYKTLSFFDKCFLLPVMLSFGLLFCSC